MLKRSFGLAAVAVLAAIAPGPVLAAGCYAGSQLAPLANAHVEDVELFILVDQTTVYPPGIADYLRSVLARKVHAGMRVSLFSFSAYAPGRYFQPRGSFYFEPQPTAREAEIIGMRTLRNLHQCLTNQASAGLQLLSNRTTQMLAPAAASYSNSDVIGSIRQIGARIAASRARSRFLIIVSDMIQNMPGNSFYAHGRLRAIDAQAEMRNVVSDEQLANLGGAQVYVVGGGLAGQGPDNQIRTPHEMNPLEHFWRAYIAKSNATLAEFGKPIASTLTR